MVHALTNNIRENSAYGSRVSMFVHVFTGCIIEKGESCRIISISAFVFPYGGYFYSALVSAGVLLSTGMVPLHLVYLALLAVQQQEVQSII